MQPHIQHKAVLPPKRVLYPKGGHLVRPFGGGGQGMERRVGAGVHPVAGQHSEVAQQQVAAGRQQCRQGKHQAGEQQFAQFGKAALLALFHGFIGQVQRAGDLGHREPRAPHAQKVRFLLRQPGQGALHVQPFVRVGSRGGGQGLGQRVRLPPQSGAPAVGGTAHRQGAQPVFQRTFAGVEPCPLKIELGEHVVDAFPHVLLVGKAAGRRGAHRPAVPLHQGGKARLRVLLQQLQQPRVRVHPLTAFLSCL